MKRIVRWLVLCCFVTGSLWAQDHSALLVGWDGAHRAHVTSLLQEGKLPNLQALIAEGKLVDIDVTSGATDTKAGWTQILTGYKPEISGVYNNARFRDVPAGYSIFERLKAQYGNTNIACLAAIGKTMHCGEIRPPFKKPFEEGSADLAADQKNRRKPGQPGANEKQMGIIVEENGQKFVVFNGSPYYTMHKSCDAWDYGLVKDLVVGDKALALLDQYGKTPFFFFVHFAEVDHSGHRHGEDSKAYDDAIISGDTQLGRMMAKLTELGVAEKTLIYVVSDHGFDLGSKRHGEAPHVFLGTNDKAVMRNGTRADIAPTVMAQLGLDLAKLEPALDGETLTKPATKPAGPSEVLVKHKKPGKKKPGASRGGSSIPATSPVDARTGT